MPASENPARTEVAIQGRGYETFKMNSKTLQKMGMPMNFYTQFMRELFKYRIKIPSKYIKDLDKLIEKSLISDSNVWSQQIVTFSTGKGGEAKSFQVLTNKDVYCNKMNVIWS